MHTKSCCQLLHHKWQCKSECGHGITNCSTDRDQSNRAQVTIQLWDYVTLLQKTSKPLRSILASLPTHPQFSLSCMVYIRAPTTNKRRCTNFKSSVLELNICLRCTKKADYNTSCHKAICRQFVLDLKGLIKCQKLGDIRFKSLLKPRY